MGLQKHLLHDKPSRMFVNSPLIYRRACNRIDYIDHRPKRKKQNFCGTINVYGDKM